MTGQYGRSDFVGTIVFVTGARGAGKTTLVDRLTTEGLATHLKPFTTRSRRDPYEDEYHFLDVPPDLDQCAWSIDVKGNRYGMLLSELEGADRSGIAITVFAPEKLEEVRNFSDRHPLIECIVIGLDTVSSIEVQAERTGQDASRSDLSEQLRKLRDLMRKQDYCFSGDAETVASAGRAVLTILASSGGVVTKRSLEPLVSAGMLLEGLGPEAVKAASCDLTVGGELWCSKEFHSLSREDPLFEIPPYSYAIVKAAERAFLPTNMVGRFDLRVGTFLNGIILSNGPQIDPGYKGDLFCVLFNASSQPFALRRNEHFATIEFTTTTTRAETYKGQYSLRDKLQDHFNATALSNIGGVISEELKTSEERIAARLEGKIPKDRLSIVLGAIAIAVTLLLFVFSELQTNATELAQRIERVDELEGQLVNLLEQGLSMNLMDPPTIP